ncbi:MAG: DUF4340 domain-containing protein [Proteobacteria bacterium]|nr:MAG: DUF4340 domain-containing protein [Pseudomonadota bacterium]
MLWQKSFIVTKNGAILAIWKRATLLDEYGLSEKRRADADRKVAVELADGKTLELIFGIKHPATDAYFVMHGENGKLDETHIFLLESSALSAIDKPLAQWRDKRIFTLAQNEVRSFELVVKKTGKTIRGKLDGGDWSVTDGTQSLPGDTDAVNALVSAGLFLNARGFAFDDQKSTDAQKLLKPLPQVIELKLTTEATSQTIRLFERTFTDQGKKASVLYAVSPEASPVFEIETSAATRVTKTFDDLRLRKLVQAMDRFGINTLKIDRKGPKPFTKLTEQREGKWRDKDRIIDGTPINRFLDALSGAALSQATLPRATELSTNTVHVEAGMSSTEIRYDYTFFEKSGKWWVLDEKRPERLIFELTPELRNTLPLTESFFPDPQPIKEDPISDDADEHSEADGHDHEMGN